MFNLSINNIVTLSRGDSISCPLFLNDGTDVCWHRRELKSGEFVFFAIERPNQIFENAVVCKRFEGGERGHGDVNEHGDIVIVLDSKDTIDLCPGTYYYEIKAKLLDKDNNYIINTVVEKTKFIII